MINPERVEIVEERLARHRKQIEEWRRKANMKTEGTLNPPSELARKHTSELMEAIAPVIKRHVAREVAKATVRLERRIAELESKQRVIKSGGVKLIGRRPVKVMGHGAVKCF